MNVKAMPGHCKDLCHQTPGHASCHCMCTDTSHTHCAVVDCSNKDKVKGENFCKSCSKAFTELHDLDLLGTHPEKFSVCVEPGHFHCVLYGCDKSSCEECMECSKDLNQRSMRPSFCEVHCPKHGERISKQQSCNKFIVESGSEDCIWKQSLPSKLISDKCAGRFCNATVTFNLMDQCYPYCISCCNNSSHNHCAVSGCKQGMVNASEFNTEVQKEVPCKYHGMRQILGLVRGLDDGATGPFTVCQQAPYSLIDDGDEIYFPNNLSVDMSRVVSIQILLFTRIFRMYLPRALTFVKESFDERDHGPDASLRFQASFNGVLEEMKLVTNAVGTRADRLFLTILARACKRTTVVRTNARVITASFKEEGHVPTLYEYNESLVQEAEVLIRQVGRLLRKVSTELAKSTAVVTSNHRYCSRREDKCCAHTADTHIESGSVRSSISISPQDNIRISSRNIEMVVKTIIQIAQLRGKNVEFYPECTSALVNDMPEMPFEIPEMLILDRNLDVEAVAISTSATSFFNAICLTN